MVAVLVFAKKEIKNRRLTGWTKENQTKRVSAPTPQAITRIMLMNNHGTKSHLKDLIVSVFRKDLLFFIDP